MITGVSISKFNCLLKTLLFTCVGCGAHERLLQWALEVTSRPRATDHCGLWAHERLYYSGLYKFTVYILTYLLLPCLHFLQDMSTVENVVKIVETALKSTHLPTKMSALHGGLYLLETGATEVSHHLVPLLGNYVLTSLTSITPYDIVLFVCLFTVDNVAHVPVWSISFWFRRNAQAKVWLMIVMWASGLPREEDLCHLSVIQIMYSTDCYHHSQQHHNDTIFEAAGTHSSYQSTTLA